VIGERFEVEFERIVPEGKAAGKVQGKNVYALGVLPGERAIVEVFRKKKRFIEAKVVELLTESPNRIHPNENHYMSCSPWQIMQYDFQATLKHQIIERCYQNIAFEELKLNDFWSGEKHDGYRTKMEYSLIYENGEHKLAFFHRGEYFKQIALERGCFLGGTQSNETAMAIVAYLNQNNFPGEILNGITLRESKTNGDVIAVIQSTSKSFTPHEKAILEGIPSENLVIAYMDPASSVRIVEETLFAKGKTYLEENMNGLRIMYPFNGFFQNNIPGVVAAIGKMKEFVYPCKSLVELYSGVGTLGLQFCDAAEKVTGIEIGPWSKEWAERNAEMNGITNYSVIVSQAEKTQQDLIADAQILVLDPPRPGLHKKVIRMIRETQPNRIIYLSCNPITQARDFGMLKDLYDVIHLSGYDFYPNTVHVESLLVMDKKK
jgi:23S rRNA (uracil1939-C5)-methyltransferase